jgi:hypothetical protein
VEKIIYVVDKLKFSRTKWEKKQKKMMKENENKNKMRQKFEQKMRNLWFLHLHLIIAILLHWCLKSGGK